MPSPPVSCLATFSALASPVPQRRLATSSPTSSSASPVPLAARPPWRVLACKRTPSSALGGFCPRLRLALGARGVSGASTGRQPRGQPLTTLRIHAPAPPTAPTWLSATVATRSSWNKAARQCHHPAPTGTPTSALELGVWLQPLPAATPLTTPRTRAPPPPAALTFDVAIGHRRNAQAGINRAPMPSPSSHRYPDVHLPLPAATRAASRSPRLDTPSPASGSADVAIGHRRHAPAGITIRAPQPYARAAAACGASANGVQSPASYSTGVGSGRLRVARAGKQENAGAAPGSGGEERAPGRQDWRHNLNRDGAAADPRAGSRSSYNCGRHMPGAAPLGPRSGKPSSASGSCRAILHWEGRPRCAQQLRSQERPAQRHARALTARLHSSGACTRGRPDADVAGDRSPVTARAAAEARVSHNHVPWWVGWARHRRLEPPASTDSARARFTSAKVATVLPVGACALP
eukprot:scaffold10975_cov105-Isochrysis_galbana.AAC.1